MLGIFSFFKAHHTHVASPEGLIYLGMYLNAYVCFLTDHTVIVLTLNSICKTYQDTIPSLRKQGPPPEEDTVGAEDA